MINKVGRFFLAKGVKFVWLFHLDVSAPSSGMIVLEQDEKAGMPDEAYTLLATNENHLKVNL